MNKKFYISFLALFISLMSFSQITRPCTIYLKSGKVITDMRGTYNKKDFKYYKNVGERYNKIKIELLDSVELIEKSGNITKLLFLPVKAEKKIQVVEQLIVGNVELYQQVIDAYNRTYNEYYIRKRGQSKLTLIGHNNFANNKKKLILYPFIDDCPELIDKIENEEFKIVNDLNLIIGTYNINCGVKKN